MAQGNNQAILIPSFMPCPSSQHAAGTPCPPEHEEGKAQGKGTVGLINAIVYTRFPFDRYTG
eukprot:1161438-Pelagomonas_calceolata.AAC.9